MTPAEGEIRKARASRVAWALHITALSKEQWNRRLPFIAKLHQVHLKLCPRDPPHMLLMMTAVTVMGMTERECLTALPEVVCLGFRSPTGH